MHSSQVYDQVYCPLAINASLRMSEAHDKNKWTSSKKTDIRRNTSTNEQTVTHQKPSLRSSVEDLVKQSKTIHGESSDVVIDVDIGKDIDGYHPELHYIDARQYVSRTVARTENVTAAANIDAETLNVVDGRHLETSTGTLPMPSCYTITQNTNASHRRLLRQKPDIFKQVHKLNSQLSKFTKPSSMSFVFDS